jgi:hypothetical protein
VARKLRIQYPGALYHVMNRGDRREPIFKDDHDRPRFLETLGEACAKTGDKHKVQMAGRLRRETTMTLKWIAERLAMGTWTNVSNLLAVHRTAKR